MEIQAGRLLGSSGCRAEKDERAIFKLSFNYVDIPRKVKDLCTDYSFQTIPFSLGLYTLCSVKKRYEIVSVENTQKASNSQIIAILLPAQPRFCSRSLALLLMSFVVVNSYTKPAAIAMPSNHVVILDLMSLVFL